jgi:hypothetical protein
VLGILLNIGITLLFLSISFKIISYSLDLFGYCEDLLRNKSKKIRFLVGIVLLALELLIILGYLRYMESNFWNEIKPVIYYDRELY